MPFVINPFLDVYRKITELPSGLDKSQIIIIFIKKYLVVYVIIFPSTSFSNYLWSY